MISRQLRYLVIGALFLAAATFASAQITTASSPKAAPATADPYRDEPYVFEKLDTTIRMKADGTGETLTHIVLRVQSEGTARQFSVLAVSYASANETGAIDYVRVHKADGSLVETPTGEAIEMPSEVTRSAPVYSDIREKHLPVRSLSVGDKLEYQFHVTRTKAEAPEQFWGVQHFALDGVVLSQIVTLEVPEKTYVQVWSPNHPATSATNDGVKTWTWTSSQTKPSARDSNGKMTAAEVKDPDEDTDGRKLPSVAWTTFRSWAQVGDWYRSLALQRAEPTDAIKAKAAELTRDARTPEEQVQALYRYVATQIRYVGISLGVGRYQPHAAAEVMANQYGDCKDKDTLLESLLKAKGFTTAPALIGAGIVPVADVPTPAVFNHVITTVQVPGDQHIWLDTTAEVAPYRVLVPVIRDQQALVIPVTGAANLQKTPSDPPYPYKERFESVGTLSDKDILKAHIQISVRSDSELVYRAVLRQVAPAQWDQMMQNVAASMNFGGKVSNTDLRQGDPATPVHIAFDYTREEYGNWKDNRIWPVWPTLEITSIDKEKAPEHDIDLGVPRTLEVESTIMVPAGDRMELPSARHVDRPYTSYDETYRFVDGNFIADRMVVIKQHKLNKDQWKDYLAFFREAGLEDSMQEAVLIPSGSSPAKTATSENGTASPADSDSATANQLQGASVASEQKNDWVAARRYAEKAVEKFPKTAYSHSVLAYVDEHDKKYEEAIAGYKEELAAHPDDNSNIVRLLAGVYSKQKRYIDAIELLKKYSDRKDLEIQQQLIYVQNLNGQPEEALNTVRQTMEWKPDDKSLQTEEARLLQQMHRNSEAAVAAKRALDGNNDPNLINSDAYFLAEARLDLPLAESSSRRSVEMFDRMNSTGAVEEANTRAFALSSQMVAAWDTLGDILLIEDKAKAAEPYLAASWFNGPDAAKGNHLSDAYERLGRKPEARLIAKLTLSLPRTLIDKDDRAAIEARDARLEKDGVKLPTNKPATLQAMRTFHLKNAVGVAGGGTVRVQLGGAGIQDATLVAGDASLKPLVDNLKSINIPPAVPPASPARVLRDAVLYCGKAAKECDLVFMETSGIAQESLPK